MHRLVIISAIASCFAGPVIADSRPADCELTVRGRTYIKGICQFAPSAGGSFRINSDNNYFAYVSVVSPGVAEASWNGSPDSTHAHASLGSLKRSGACWIGDQAKICARSLSPAAEKAALAAQPSGEALFPEIASQACLGIKGDLKPGSALVLHNCRVPTDLIFVRQQDRSLGIAKRTDLCLGVESSAASKPPQLVLQACRPESVRWTTSATSTEAAPVQSSANMCLTIPQLDDPNARFPFTVHATPCSTARDKAVRFHLSKG